MGLEMSNWVQKSEWMQGLAGSKSSKICVLCLKCKDELRKTHFFRSSLLGYGPKPAIAQCSLSVSTYIYFHTPGLHTEHWFLRAASIDVVGEKLNSPKSVWLVSLAPSSWCIAALSLCAAFWCGMLEKNSLTTFQKSLTAPGAAWLFMHPQAVLQVLLAARTAFDLVFSFHLLFRNSTFLALRCNEVCLNRGGNTALIF